MATPKGTNGTLLGKQYSQDWSSFVEKRNRNNDWQNWLWGSKINKSKVAKHIGFSIDVFDDNPDVDVHVVEKDLVEKGIINPNTEKNVTANLKEKTKLSSMESARLKKLEESSNLLQVDLQNLASVLMKKQNEITVVNFTLPEQKRLDLNILTKTASITPAFSSHLSDQARLKEAELLNIQKRELKLIAQMWLDRLDVSEHLLSKYLRVPTWL